MLIKMKDKLILSSSPHIHSGESIAATMHNVILALLPASLVGVYYFGLPALAVLSLAIVSCLVFEAAAQRQ